MDLKNGQISKRQIFRLFVFDLMGIGTLLLPPYLAKLCGLAGVWAIVIGSGLGILYLFYLGWILRHMGTDLLSYLERHGNRILRWFLCVGIVFHGILTGGFVANVFVGLMQHSLVSESNFGIVLLVVLCAGAYAVTGGIESRARVYEVLFFFVLLPYVIMMGTSVRNCKPVYLDGLFQCSAGDLGKGIYLVFLLLTPLFFTLLLQGNQKHNCGDGVVKPVSKAVVLTMVLLLGSFLLLVGNFGSASLGNMRFPVVSLMSTIQFEGTFLKRMDAFMVAIWFFTLFALLNLHMHYGVLMYETLCKSGKRKRSLQTYVVPGEWKKRNLWGVFLVAAAVYAVAAALEYWEDGMNLFLKYYSFVAVPFMVIGPFLLFIMTGCAATELEEKTFPLMVVTDYEEDFGQIVFGAGFPRLDSSADSDGKSSGLEVKLVQAKTFEESKYKYESDLNKAPDYNHLKVLVLGENLIEHRERLTEMVHFLAEEEQFPRNTYVCVVDDVDDLLELDKKLTQDIGTYLEEYIINHGHTHMPVTLGNLIDEMYNQKLVLYLPFLEAEDGNISQKGYLEIKMNPVE